MHANTPDERAVTRAAIAAKRMAESKAMNKLKRQLRARTDIGKEWDGTAANDNRIDWPLSKAMIKDGNIELLKAAIRYRGIHEKAMSEPFLGDYSGPSGDLSIAYKVTMTSDGVSYHGEVVRRSASVDIPAQRAAPTLTTSKQRAAPVPRPWSGDTAVNDAMDARQIIAAIRNRLGPLAEPMELAVVDGATLEKCGNAAGVANRAGAMSAGKVLVYNALIIARDTGLMGRV